MNLSFLINYNQIFFLPGFRGTESAERNRETTATTRPTRRGRKRRAPQPEDERDTDSAQTPEGQFLGPGLRGAVRRIAETQGAT